MHASRFTFPPLLDIAFTYDKYVAQKQSTMTKIITYSTLAHGFAIFSLQNRRNCLHPSIKLQSNRNTVYQNKLY